MQEKERLRKDTETKIRILLHDLVIFIIVKCFSNTKIVVLISAVARNGAAADGHGDQDLNFTAQSDLISNRKAF